MNKKLILIIFCLFLVFFSAISFSCASEVADNENVSAIDEEIVQAPEQQEILTDSSGSFDELEDLVTDSPATLELNKSFTYSSGNTTIIKISKDITVEGNHNTIDASNQASIFAIEDNHHVILQNIIFKNAYGVNGSAVKVGLGSSVEIINCTFINNNATQFGGAVYLVAETSTVTSKIVNSIFEGNSAHNGGAVYINSDNAILEDLTFTGNYAANDGALYVAGDDCSLANSTFTGNIAGDDGPAVYWEGSNGLIYNITCTNNKGTSTGSTTKGGTIIITGSNVTVRKSSFTNSFAGFDGGALFITGNDVNVIDCDFDNCTAKDEHGGALYIIGNNTHILDCDFNKCNANLSGGVIYVVGNDVVINNSTFTRNGANLDGGALFVSGDNCILANSTFTSNVAGDDGGAIYWEGDNGVIYNITCYDNKGISDIDPTDGTRSNSKGGTICLTGSNVTIDKSSFTKSSAVVDGGALFITGNGVNVYNSTFDECTSTNSSGGALYIIGNDTDVVDCIFNKCNVNSDGNNPRGGAIYVDGNNGNISRSSFTNTRALIGGAIYIAGDDTIVDDSLFRYNDASGSTMAAGGTGGAIYVDGARATVSNSDFAYDNAVNYGGAIAIWGPNAVITKNTFDNSSTTHYHGGSIFVSGFNATISLSNFTRSKATYKDDSGAACGGAIEVYGSGTNILDCNFEDCFAYYGGVIHISGSNAIVNNSNFKKSSIYKTESPYWGAAIFVDGAYTTILKSNFTDYTAKEYGGAIYVAGTNANISESNFVNCNANNFDGGAIYITGENTNIEWSNFTLCKANAGQGGAIRILNGPNTFIHDSNFDQCEAEKGGDIYVFGNNAKIEDSTFNSSSAQYGGAIYLESWGALIKGSNITECDAGYDGGAIYVEGGGTNIVESSFEGCVARGTSSTYGGGAIYIAGPDTSIKSSDFNDNRVSSEKALGGTIYIKGERTHIEGSDFNDSFAGEGGIIYIEGEDAVIDASTFANSSSKGYGGAISVHGHDATIENSKFDNISAKSHGGAIFVDGESTDILRSSFYNCTNGNYLGGAIYINDIETTIAYSNFTLCKASTAGAIYVNGVNTTISYCNLDNNAAGAAGAIKVFGNNTIISNSNFTYNNATYTHGGALDIGGTNASVYACWFDHNDAVGNGGAINWQGGHGNDTILGSTFTNNGCHGIREGGGAIFWTQGDPENIPPGGLILNCIFINNTAHVHHGGAIDWFYARDSTINNCLFINNTAMSDGGALYTGDQNGKGHRLMMSNNQFYNNTAGKHGGAIANQMSDSWIYNNTFDGNKAKASGGTILMKEGHADNSTIDHCYIYNSFIDQNYAGNIHYGVGGGAIRIGDKNITISNCAIINSTANRTYGGAISIDGSSVNSSLINVTIQNSRILDGYGGAIFWSGMGGTLDNVTIVNSSSSIVNNDKNHGGGDLSDKSANGGAIYLKASDCNLNDIKIFQSSTNSTNESCTKTNYGGAIYVSGSSNTLTNVVIDDSSSNSVKMNANGGAIYWSGASGTLINATISNTLANGRGGAIYWTGGSPTISNIFIEYSQTNVTNSSNSADGGAIYLENIANLTNVYIVDALASRDVGDIYGGAIYYKNINKGTTSMNNVTVIGSRASTGDGQSYGGAVYWITAANTHDMYNSTFIENTADYGGAVYSVGTTNIWNTSFTGNVALDGGALYGTSGDDVLNNASFSHNSAKRGGAIFVNNQQIRISNSSLEFNTAEQKGGAIYYNNVNMNNNRNTEITRTNLTNNTAFQGSAIYGTKFRNVYLQDVILLDNQANSKEFIEKAVGVDGDGNNYTSAVFIGFDNLLNAIWQDSNADISCDNVTYWGVDGKTVTSSSPTKSDREVNINVTIEMFDGKGEKINETVVVTDENGRAKLTFNAKEDEDYYFAFRHDADRYYTYLRDTLSNRSLVTIFVHSPLYYAQNQTVLIYLTDGAWGELNGTVTVTFNDTAHTNFTMNVTNGSATRIFAHGLPIGTYNATASFAGDENHTGDTDWTLFTVLPYDDLKITKDVNVIGNYVNVTDQIKYTINVTNLGPSDAKGVNVTEILSSYLKYIGSQTNNHGYYNVTNGTWYIGDLSVGDIATLTITAEVIHIGPITNTVWVTGEGFDTNLTNNIASARNLTALAFADLKITKTDNVGTVRVVNVTDRIEFVISVVNQGPYNATGVYVNETLSPHLRFISYNATIGKYDNGTTWNIGNLTVGKVHNLTIVAEVISAGNITNVVIVTGFENDTNLTNNVDRINNITAIPIVDLAITKEANVSGVVNVSDVVKFTVTIKNNGPCDATDVMVTERLSNLLKVVDGGIDTTAGSYNPVTGLWNIEKLANQSTATLTIKARVIGNGTIANVVVVTSNENDTNKSNNNDSIKNITSLPVVDVVITKEVNVSGFVNVTDKIKFTITVFNKGPSNATGVNVTEKLSDLLEIDNIEISKGFYNSTTGVWNIGDLANNTGASLNITAIVIGNGTIANVVVVTSNENDTNKSNNNDSIKNITALPIVDLEITKTVNVNVIEVNVGDKLEFIIHVHNNGPCNATGVYVTEVLSPCLKMISNVTQNGYYNVERGIWYIGDLANGSDAVLTIEASVVYSGNISNVVIVYSNENDTNKSNNKDNITNITAHANVDRGIVKKVNVSGVVNVTDLIEFTVTAYNVGPCNATGVYVLEALDSHLELVSYNATKGTYEKAYTWNIGNLDKGEKVNLTIIARVMAPGNITNYVEIFGWDNDTNKSNDNDSIKQIKAQTIVDVEITKETNATTVNITDKIKFTITVRNNGPCNATGVYVNETLDFTYLGLDYYWNATKGYYDGYTWTINDLANQSSEVLTIIANVTKLGKFSNFVSVNVTEKDTNITNNYANVTNITILPIVDVKVNKTVNATKVIFNDFVEYEIAVKNNGPCNASDVNVTDKLDSRLSFVSFKSSRDGITYDSSTGVATIGNLDVGETVILTIIAKVSGIGEIPNYVHVTSRENDTNTSNNHNSSDNVTGLPIVDVSINKTVSVSEVRIGEEFTYTIIVHNNGPNDASDVNVTEKLSKYVSLVSFNATKGDYSDAKNSWYISNLANNEISTLTLTVKAVGVGIIENVVYVTSSGNDTNLTNNNYTCENVTALKLDTPIDLDCYNITYGDDEIITVILPTNATGTVNITVGDKHYDDVKIDNGHVELPVSDLGGGDYNVTVDYGGDGVYNPNSTTGKFTVYPVTPIITIEVEDIWVGEVEILNVTVNAPGYVFVTVNNVTVEIPLENGVVTTGLLLASKFSNYKGNATWNIWGLPVGPYPAFALYPGNENYTSVNTSDLFHVRDLPSTVVVTAEDIYVGEDAIINIKVGPGGVSGDVFVTVEGVPYVLPIDENGEAVLVVSGLKAGLKDVTVEYEGTVLYRPSENSTTFNVLKVKPPVDVISPDITIGDDAVITVSVPDDATGTITIEIESKRYTAPIKDGKAVFVVPGLKVGLHDIKVFYSGDDKYLPTNTTGSIKVNPKDEPPVVENRTTHEKVGLEVHETGNPILLAIIVLLSCGVAQIRRFRK